MRTSATVLRSLGSLAAILAGACGRAPESHPAGAGETATAPRAPHVVFVTGDEEYRSEESMPMLAEILEREFGLRTTVCYALDEQGQLDPERRDSIDGLEALDDADLLVLFTRFRQLPEEQLAHLRAYLERGGPLVGFRTSTHAFAYPDGDPRAAEWNELWPKRVFGQGWITHHGHFDDGARPLTAVALVPGAERHPILRGVQPFEAYSWLYHVQGGGDRLPEYTGELLFGTALRSSHAHEPERYPPTQPVAWTRNFSGPGGLARVFFTTLGHPYDFLSPDMRRLAVQGILWALGEDHRIPEQGAAVESPDYQPSNSGFGRAYRRGVYPRLAARGSARHFDLRPGDRLALVGGDLCDRQRFDPWFEAELQAARPGDRLTVRNLCWNGDVVTRFELGGRRVQNGGPGDTWMRPQGFPERSQWLLEVEADHLLLFVGGPESFAGEAGLPAFERDLGATLDDLRQRSFDGGEAAVQVVLVSPTAHENLGYPLPDGREHDAQLARYTAAVARLAAERELLFVDLHTPFRAALDRGEGPLTSDGVAPNSAGQRLVARTLLAGLGLAPGPEAAAERLLPLVREKDRLWFDRYRTLNAEYVHGRRVEPFGAVDFPPRFAALAERLARADGELWQRAAELMTEAGQ
jgi:type 1 glutamine amidotransferase/lysophospholipase L1-like esterase